MDVYLQPLVEELQILWEGIQVFDMSKPSHTHTQRQLGAFLCGKCMTFQDMESAQDLQ